MLSRIVAWCLLSDRRNGVIQDEGQKLGGFGSQFESKDRMPYISYRSVRNTGRINVTVEIKKMSYYSNRKASRCTTSMRYQCLLMINTMIGTGTAP